MKAKDAIRQIREEEAPASAPETLTPHSAAKAAAESQPKFDPAGPWESWMQTALDGARTRFIGERVSGFTHRGRAYPGVPQTEAEQRWTKVEENFKAVLQNDPEVAAKLSIQEDAAPKSSEAAAPSEPPKT